MSKNNIYLTADSIKWALIELSKVPKDQLVLLFYLMIAKSPTVQRGQNNKKSSFEVEFDRYLSAPVVGGGLAVFNPLVKKWMAANYTNSTVFGRLLNGSHHWTEGAEAFFERTPSKGWPAKFKLTDVGFDNLRSRTSPPCLKSESRLPLNALAIYYYRFEDLTLLAPQSLSDLVDIFKKDVLSCNRRLIELFVNGSVYLRGELFTNMLMHESEMVAIYPTSPYSTEPKKNALLYEDDIEAIKLRLLDGEDVSDYVRKMLRKEKIWK